MFPANLPSALSFAFFSLLQSQKSSTPSSAYVTHCGHPSHKRRKSPTALRCFFCTRESQTWGTPSISVSIVPVAVFWGRVFQFWTPRVAKTMNGSTQPNAALIGCGEASVWTFCCASVRGRGKQKLGNEGGEKCILFCCLSRVRKDSWITWNEDWVPEGFVCCSNQWWR